MLDAECDCGFTVLRMHVLLPEVLLQPCTDWISKQPRRLRAYVSHLPGLGVGQPGHRATGLQQHPLARFALAHFLLHALAIGDVDAGTDISFESLVRIEAGNAHAENPAIFAVEAAQTKFNLKTLAGVKSPVVDVQAALHVIGMDTVNPPVTDLVFHGLAGEMQPALIEISGELVGPGHPDHHWRSVSEVFEAVFAFPL